MQNGLAMSVKEARSLIELKAGLSDPCSFYCLEEQPIGSPNGKAIIFLHGLGENRTGLNYLFHELSLGLRTEGYAVYRFDLAGCGESSLHPSIKIWKDQLESIKNFTRKYTHVHMISRGVSSILLPLKDHSVNIAIGPISETLFNKQLPLIPVEEHLHLWIPAAEQKMTSETESFWSGLGVEAGCLGGFYLPKTFIEELKLCIFPTPSEVKVILPGRTSHIPLSSQTYHLPDCHPLFFPMKDRRILLNKIKEILNNADE